MAIRQGKFVPYTAYQFAKDTTMSNDIEIIEKIVTPNYIKIKLNTKNFNFIDKVDEWCYATGCGKRVNTTSFAFKTDAELMMFTLRWSPKK